MHERVSQMVKNWLLNLLKRFEKRPDVWKIRQILLKRNGAVVEVNDVVTSVLAWKTVSCVLKREEPASLTHQILCHVDDNFKSRIIS
jgi:hypothetical protein